MNGKGDKASEIPKSELEIRKELLDGPEADKPALMAKLNRLADDRRAHGLYKGATDK